MSVEFFPQQRLAIKLLSRESPVTKLLYGGGVYGGKSFLIQQWQFQKRIAYPASFGFIGRNDLGDIRKFTVPEFMRQLNNAGLRLGKEYTYNGQDMFLEFYNKSRTYFIDMYHYPSDPNFQRFGSSQYMDGAIEEAAEVTEKAVNIIFTRIRQDLTKYCRKCGEPTLHDGLVVSVDDKGNPDTWVCGHCGDINGGILPKLLMSCNPDIGHLRSNFYTPWEKGELPENMAFVPSLATDNPRTPKQYIDEFMLLPEMDRRRLLYGDWYYDESPDAMFQYKDLQACFNDQTGEGDYYISADIARFGKDKTIIGAWHGLTLVEIIVHEKQPLNVVWDSIRVLMEKYSVKIRNVICDEDGIGGGVVDALGCTGFLNGGKPHDSKRFVKAKDECYFKLAEYVERAKVNFRCDHKDKIIKELEAIRREKPDGDTKLRVIDKEKQKALLNGRSPDFADMIMMRMYFELHPNRGKYTFA